MKTSDFDFNLPPSLIAQKPAPKRDSSRLLFLQKDGDFLDRRFTDLPEYLREGDMLLLNKTKVLPMRLRGMRPDGRSIEMLLVRNIKGKKWEVMSRGGYTGEVVISENLRANLYNGKTAALKYTGDLRDLLWEHGEMPLPPYIKRTADHSDKKRYQTVYAESEGSIAAPTAGLHLTEDLLREIEDKGVLVRRLTLHVGKGTFIPVRADLINAHAMESERFEIDVSLVEDVRNLKGRLIAVGTTTARAIEGLLSGGAALEESKNGIVRGSEESKNGIVRGSTDLFIYPGFNFRAVDGLITNFHLPRSTPLMLASALSGLENLLRAYAHAVLEEYGFFSYGDAMLIL
jgi:S-adenosylmethionine:tRNA ribosyltransferase-isomerase